MTAFPVKLTSLAHFRAWLASRRGAMKAALAIGLAAGLLAGAPGLAVAQEGMERTELQRADLAGVDGMEVVQAILVVQPGTLIPRHIHYGDEFSYVLEGAMLEQPDGQIVELKTGTSIHFPREVPHGGATVVGDNPLKLLTVHIVDKDKPFSVLVE